MLDRHTETGVLASIIIQWQAKNSISLEEQPEELEYSTADNKG